MVADIVVPCASCGRPMARRRNSHNNSEFLACVGYLERDHENRPSCAETMPLPEYFKLLDAGAPMLPGF